MNFDWTHCPIIVLPAACVWSSWKSSWEGGEEEQNNIKEEPCGVDGFGKAILLIVCRMHSRLLQAKRLQGLLGWTENCGAFSCPCLTWLMGVSYPLGHLQELGSGVSHCRVCCRWGFDQSSAFVVERIYLISADSKQRWAVQCHCHRTRLPSLSPNKRRTKANDQPNYVLFPPSRLLWVLVHSLLPRLKGIMLGWFQSCSLLAVFFNVSIKVVFQLPPMTLEKYLASYIWSSCHEAL